MENLLKARRYLAIFKYTSLISVVVLIWAFISFYSPSYQSSINHHSNPEDTKLVEDGFKIDINQSVFTGFSKQLDSYTITADKVKKNYKQKYLLDQVTAKYLLKNRSEEVTITSTAGIFNEDTRLIALQGTVRADFMEFILQGQELIFDLINKNTYSNSQVEAQYKNSFIKADSFRAENMYEVINFEGNVNSSFNPNDF